MSSLPKTIKSQTRPKAQSRPEKSSKDTSQGFAVAMLQHKENKETELDKQSPKADKRSIHETFQDIAHGAATCHNTTNTHYDNPSDLLEYGAQQLASLDKDGIRNAIHHSATQKYGKMLKALHEDGTQQVFDLLTDEYERNAAFLLAGSLISGQADFPTRQNSLINVLANQAPSAVDVVMAERTIAPQETGRKTLRQRSQDECGYTKTTNSGEYSYWDADQARNMAERTELNRTTQQTANSKRKQIAAKAMEASYPDRSTCEITVHNIFLGSSPTEEGSILDNILSFQEQCSGELDLYYEGDKTAGPPSLAYWSVNSSGNKSNAEGGAAAAVPQKADATAPKVTPENNLPHFKAFSYNTCEKLEHIPVQVIKCVGRMETGDVSFISESGDPICVIHKLKNDTFNCTKVKPCVDKKRSAQTVLRGLDKEKIRLFLTQNLMAITPKKAKLYVQVATMTPSNDKMLKMASLEAAPKSFGVELATLESVGFLQLKTSKICTLFEKVDSIMTSSGFKGVRPVEKNQWQKLKANPKDFLAYTINNRHRFSMGYRACISSPIKFAMAKCLLPKEGSSRQDTELDLDDDLLNMTATAIAATYREDPNTDHTPTLVGYKLLSQTKTFPQFITSIKDNAYVKIAVLSSNNNPPGNVSSLAASLELQGTFPDKHFYDDKVAQNAQQWNVDIGLEIILPIIKDAINNSSLLCIIDCNSKFFFAATDKHTRLIHQVDISDGAVNEKGKLKPGLSCIRRQLFGAEDLVINKMAQARHGMIIVSIKPKP